MAQSPSLMILGTHHFDRQNDAVNFEADDVLSRKRQDEIVDLVNRLKHFGPTKITVEASTDNDAEINERYKRYLEGIYRLSRDEIDQVGFRLARAMEHPKVYPIDWREPPVGVDTDFETFAKDHGQADLLEDALQVARDLMKRMQEIQSSGSLLDLYLFGNDPERLRESHSLYFKIARIGKVGQFPGADWVQHWYGRNLKIFVNLTRLVEAHDERILLIIGSGHAWLLRQFAEEDGLFLLEDPRTYLQ